MKHPVVDVHGLCRTYERPKKEPGLRGTLRAFVRPQVECVEALRGISFEVAEGEILGCIGPNGAGKTTTLKILAGVLFPNGGEARVLGFMPFRRERAFLQRISFVMSGSGFLAQTTWDLSVLDGFQLIREVYGLNHPEYSKSLEELVGLFELEELVGVPLRQLSHGQRQRVELAGALLWRPRLLLLDEPTLGLDIISQRAIRDFVKAYVRRSGAACIVTSHNMRDIEEMADRLILIDHGELIVEGPPSDISKRLSDYKFVRVEFAREPISGELATLGEVVSDSALQATLRVRHDRVKSVAQALLARWPVRDMSIREQSLEEALLHYFSQGEGNR